ncbi:MAG: SDR family oxidoreductase [Fuerstiella sp.]|jgi:NAD(P)-dependent dehydrogenase (short-subunit alcohol dehydrogenase family)|nr:SDR family oxidoreductase [Fuerstiella sp.]MDG2128616.1 SDR family oxidoreductase [Fuerstiella sp.]
MIHLKGHSALVTGSTKGVGKAIAEAFAAAGANVVIHGRRESPESEVVLANCRRTGVTADFITGDLSGPTEAVVAEVFDNAISVMPDIDILVNNAGTYIDRPYLDMDMATYETTMRLNVAAPYFLTQRFARRWIEAQTAGRVLMIGSINGQLAEPVHTCYDASKGAVAMMVRSCCVSLAPHRIRVNGLAPGLVSTPLTSIIEEDSNFKSWMCLHTPNGEVPGPEVCGDGAVYLVSDAAQHVHGHMLMVDGGMSGWQQPDMPSVWGEK